MLEGEGAFSSALTVVVRTDSARIVDSLRTAVVPFGLTAWFCDGVEVRVEARLWNVGDGDELVCSVLVCSVTVEIGILFAAIVPSLVTAETGFWNLSIALFGVIATRDGPSESLTVLTLMEDPVEGEMGEVLWIATVLPLASFGLGWRP